MPEIIEKKFRNQGDKLRAIMSRNQSEYARIKDITDPENIVDLMDQTYPGYADDIGITLMPDIIDIVAARVMNEMEWSVINTSKSHLSFLTCDRPLILTEDTPHKDCLIALPISPKHVFLASRPSKKWSRLHSISHDNLIKAVNYETVNKAILEVFSTDERQQSFVQNHFKQNKS